MKIWLDKEKCKIDADERHHLIKVGSIHLLYASIWFRKPQNLVLDAREIERQKDWWIQIKKLMSNANMKLGAEGEIIWINDGDIQGGMLSHDLFNVYIDDQIRYLEAAGLNPITYVDDTGNFMRRTCQTWNKLWISFELKLKEK